MSEIIEELFEVIEDRRENPKENSYTSSLLENGENSILEKIGEESTELIIASKQEKKDEIINESADLIYHLLVLLTSKKIDIKEVFEELENRRR